jgi:hypothetical protein
MTPALDGIVPPPRTDRPVLADPTTATLFTFMRTQVISTAALVGTAVAAVLLAGQAALVGLDGWVADLMVFLALAAVLVVEAYVVGTGLASLGWRRVRPMLERSEWRPVTVTVLIGRGTVLALPDGSRVRVWLQTPALRDVIARTGQVWLAGPDERGWFAARVPGAHVPWPARLVPGSSSEGRPLAATDTDLAADHLRQTGRLQAISLTAWAGLAVVAGVAVPLGSPVPEVDLLLAAFGAAMAVYRGVYLVQYRRLAALRRGPWQRLEATVAWGKPKRNLVADATGTVRLASGERFSLVMKNASLSVLAAVQEGGAVWVAGDPVSGKDHVLGFPGYPPLAKARLTAE